MRRANQVGAFAFLVLALFVLSEVRWLPYYTDIGPGPGFFPFWLSLTLAGLATAHLLQISLKADRPLEDGFVPDRLGVTRVASIVVALTLFGLFVDTIGYQLAMLAFLLYLLVALGRQNFLVTLVISVTGSFGLYWVLKTWMDVQLPSSSIDFLRTLGL